MKSEFLFLVSRVDFTTCTQHPLAVWATDAISAANIIYKETNWKGQIAVQQVQFFQRSDLMQFPLIVNPSEEM